jgi:hypothetical protein
MPFISSVRGSFGSQSKLKARANSAMLSTPTGGSITTSGGYRIHTFTTVGNNTFSKGPNLGTLDLNIEMFAYGAGGASGSTAWGNSSGWSFGGGGGYTYGVVNASSASYLVKVGAAGSFASGQTLNEGGGAGGTSWGNGGGGGLSGIFDTSYSFSNAILIAGGGGGGGTSRLSGQGVNRGGGGGGSTGQNGTSASGNRSGKGGTQTGTQLPDAGDYASGGWIAPGQLTGGHPEPHGGGGGGGYYGGSGGAYFEPNDMGGGGGGSSYAAPTVSSASLQQASYQSPPQGTYYNGSYGNGATGGSAQSGQQGQVIIRYLI